MGSNNLNNLNIKECFDLVCETVNVKKLLANYANDVRESPINDGYIDKPRLADSAENLAQFVAEHPVKANGGGTEKMNPVISINAKDMIATFNEIVGAMIVSAALSDPSTGWDDATHKKFNDLVNDFVIAHTEYWQHYMSQQYREAYLRNRDDWCHR